MKGNQVLPPRADCGASGKLAANQGRVLTQYSNGRRGQRGRPKILTENQVSMARTLRGDGYSIAQISDLIGVCRSTIWRATRDV